MRQHEELQWLVEDCSRRS